MMTVKHTVLRLSCALLALLALGTCVSCQPGGPGADTEGTTGAEGSAPAPETDFYLDDDPDFVKLPKLSTMRLSDASVTVDVTAHGVAAGDPNAAAENKRIVNKLIEDAAPGTAIVFPAGVYYMTADETGCIGVGGKQDILLYGAGAKLINVSFTPIMEPNTDKAELHNFFWSYMSKNVTIEGFELDYLMHTCADGTITDIKGGYTYFTVFDEFVTGDKPALTGGELPRCVNLFTADGVPGDEYYLDMSQGIRLEKVDDGQPNTFRLKGSYGKKKQCLSVRFSSSSYTEPMIRLQSTEGVTVRGVTVRSNGGVVCYCDSDVTDLWFDKVTVAPYDDSRQFFATNSDVLHATGLRGRLDVTDCTFVGLGDDAVNVHTRLNRVGTVEGSTIYAYSKGTDHAPGAEWIHAGDRVRFFDPDCRRAGEATVLSYKDGYMTVDELPDGIGDGWTFQNLAYCPVTRIRRCTVSRARARAFLIQTAEALIEDCTVENLRLSAVIVSPDFDEWYEAGFSDHVIIRGNTFRDCCLNVGSGEVGVILISGCHDRHAFPADDIESHKLVSVTDNYFLNCRKTCAVFARSLEKLEWNDNVVTGCRGEYTWVGHD